jgi:hypothetical protein
MIMMMMMIYAANISVTAKKITEAVIGAAKDMI